MEHRWVAAAGSGQPTFHCYRTVAVVVRMDAEMEAGGTWDGCCGGGASGDGPVAIAGDAVADADLC